MVAQALKAPELVPCLPAEEFERRQRRANSSLPELWNLLDAVKDPEIPVISLWEMGILQDIQMQGERVVVTITPTYSGCPALHTMAEDVMAALESAGFQAEVVSRLAPAWSSTWMSDEAREKLRVYGIAPPTSESVACPNCGSDHVRLISEFGSTACKALYQCSSCGEPFDYFKPI